MLQNRGRFLLEGIFLSFGTKMKSQEQGHANTEDCGAQRPYRALEPCTIDALGYDVLSGQQYFCIFDHEYLERTETVNFEEIKRKFKLKHNTMGECNAILSAYTLYRHLGYCCSHPSNMNKQV